MLSSCLWHRCCCGVRTTVSTLGLWPGPAAVHSCAAWKLKGVSHSLVVGKKQKKNILGPVNIIWNTNTRAAAQIKLYWQTAKLIGFVHPRLRSHHGSRAQQSWRRRGGHGAWSNSWFSAESVLRSLVLTHEVPSISKACVSPFIWKITLMFCLSWSRLWSPHPLCPANLSEPRNRTIR